MLPVSRSLIPWPLTGGSAFVLVYSFPENVVLSQLMQSSNGFWMSHKVHGWKVKPFSERCAYFYPENHISKPPECRVPCSSSGSCDKAVTGRVDCPLLNSTILKLHTARAFPGHEGGWPFTSSSILSFPGWLYLWLTRDERSNERSGQCCIVMVATNIPYSYFLFFIIESSVSGNIYAILFIE